MPENTGTMAATLALAVARYQGAGPFARRYIAEKLRRDPVMRSLFELGAIENFGAVADLGCGRAQCSAALLVAGLARAVVGVDCQAGQLAQARAALRGLPFEARLQDFSADQCVPAADTVLLIDVLYQLDTAAQLAVVRNVAVAARRQVIIRTADPAKGARSTTTRLLEKAFRRIWPHSGATVNATPPAVYAGILAESGFECAIEPCWQGTPFSNVLLTARRAPAGAGQAEESVLF